MMLFICAIEGKDCEQGKCVNCSCQSLPLPELKYKTKSVKRRSGFPAKCSGNAQELDDDGGSACFVQHTQCAGGYFSSPCQVCRLFICSSPSFFVRLRRCCGMSVTTMSKRASKAVFN